MSTGTAAGSVDRTPRSVVEQALMNVRLVPDSSGFEHDRGNRVRVILTLADPPLAAATYVRGFAGLGVKRKLNVHTAFSRSRPSRRGRSRVSTTSFRPPSSRGGIRSSSTASQ